MTAGLLLSGHHIKVADIRDGLMALENMPGILQKSWEMDIYSNMCL